MTALKLRAIGNSVGVILPKEELQNLGLKAGDTIYLTRAVGGSRITPFEPGFEEQMTLARQIAKKYRDALRELAK
ncbi:MAG TPA: AbrB/MazE/SpoVT family DNA-binding domain-containing protein [Beijerinckiaceae bacterium]|nr:AbrB/MazE/SpoVT family DNA-binding domain-containing protein [Beijerinckiaceae bacterium]